MGVADGCFMGTAVANRTGCCAASKRRYRKSDSSIMQAKNALPMRRFNLIIHQISFLLFPARYSISPPENGRAGSLFFAVAKTTGIHRRPTPQNIEADQKGTPSAASEVL